MQKRCDCAFYGKDTWCISRIRLFRDFSPEIQKKLIREAAHSEHPKGSTLVSEGDEIRSVLIIRSGKVKTRRIEASGEEHILDVLHDGQAVWHGIFLKNPQYRYDVVCLTDVTLCEIPREELTGVFRRNPQVSMNLIEMLSTELEEAEEKILLLSIREPQKRIAEFLLWRDHRCLGDEIHLKLDDIASSVNLRIETVSRNLVRMEREELVARVGRGRLKVLDRERLRAYAGEEEGHVLSDGKNI